MAKNKKFLLINFFGIGDVLFTTPVVANLRSCFPEAEIGFVCNKRTLPILENNPKINHFYLYDRDDDVALWKRSRREWLCKLAKIIGEIREQGYDASLDFSLNCNMPVLAQLAGIKKRIGFDYKGRGWCLTHRVKTSGFKDRHVVEHYAQLLSFLSVPVLYNQMEVFPKAEDYRWAKETLHNCGIQAQDTVVGLVPGGGVSWGNDVVYRRWPAQQHAALADEIIRKFNVKVVLLGDKSEQDLGLQVVAAMKNSAVSLIGKTTIGQYLALLRQCRLVVLNDGGPLHMAVAAGARTVSLIGPVDAAVYGPYPAEGHQVVTSSTPCRPCYRNFRRAQCAHARCLRDITVSDVLAKVSAAMMLSIGEVPGWESSLVSGKF